MKIKLLTIEDGLNNTGFRKLAAYVKAIHDDTDIYYVVTGNVRSFSYHLMTKGANALTPQDVEIIAQSVCDADIVGFSSMTQYAGATVEVIEAIRRLNPDCYIVWGGIHAIMEPEDAIKHADAVCTGEGEFAFAFFLESFKAGQDVSKTPGFWFNTPDGIKRNMNLPLMKAEEMDQMPIPVYQDGEYILHNGVGFKPITAEDHLFFNGLAYKTVWSIGCPLRCTYCGNTKFIDYDKNYRKIRHSSPKTIIAELKHVVSKHPHVSSIVFDDDSFMALPQRVMDEFTDLYIKEIGLPFVVTGLIPNYVKEEKLRLLIHAGMNRVRMGIQSGSQAILDFYDRPTPIGRVRDACTILNQFKDYMIPPAFDIILDNPIETVEDNRATLDLIYEMPRPYTLNVFSLRIIPNTRMSDSLEERGVSIDDIRKPYTQPRPTLSNILVFLMAAFPLPQRFFRWMRDRALPTHMEQRQYPVLMLAARFLYLSKRALDHLIFLDLTVGSGRPAVWGWKLGPLKLWRKWMLPRFAAKRREITPPPPKPPPVARRPAATQDVSATPAE
jgi:anaerobic magnesium-protoporphyrin IX monomethyl ester cyclase